LTLCELAVWFQIMVSFCVGQQLSPRFNLLEFIVYDLWLSAGRRTRKSSTYRRWRTWCGRQWRPTVSRQTWWNTSLSCGLRMRRFVRCWAQVVTRSCRPSAVRALRPTGLWPTTTTKLIRVSLRIVKLMRGRVLSKFHSMNWLNLWQHRLRQVHLRCYLQHQRLMLSWTISRNTTFNVPTLNHE